MKLHWYNRNIVGVHFGGSLYSMTDPHLMLMLMNLLGKNYIIWDRSASIDFIRPGKGKVTAVFKINDQDLATIKEQTKDGGIYYPEFRIMVVDQKGKTVAKITKVLYVREKKESNAEVQETRG
jgi:acyl-coenzyme A thioesterase PaaI-like protein